VAVEAPPREIILTWERWFPGFWRGFSNALRRGVQIGGPLQATSWFRSVADNAGVGGDRFSQHLGGVALDLVADNPRRSAEALRGAGLLVVEEFDHLHVQTFPAGVMQEFGVLQALGVDPFAAIAV